MVSFTVLFSALFASVAFAQQPTESFNSTIITKVAGEVDLTTKSSWCNAQQNSCGSLCGGNVVPGKNTCDAGSLNYTCICASNNSAPALQYYSPTMLSFICNTARGDCLAANAQSQSQQANCMNTIVCGNSSVTDAASSATSAAASSGTASPTGSSTGGSGSSTPSATQTGSSGASTSNAATANLQISTELATGFFGAALLAIFGFVL